MNILVIILCILIGAMLIIIRTLNMLLGKEIGIYGSNLVNHMAGVAGSSCLYIIAILSGLNKGAGMSQLPWYALTGGLMGCMFVVLSNYTFSKTGVITSTILILAGQFFCSLLIDLLVLNIRIKPINIAGALIICAGVILYSFEGLTKGNSI